MHKYIIYTVHVLCFFIMVVRFNEVDKKADSHSGKKQPNGRRSYHISPI